MSLVDPWYFQWVGVCMCNILSFKAFHSKKNTCPAKYIKIKKFKNVAKTIVHACEAIPNSTQDPMVNTKRRTEITYCHRVVGPGSETSFLNRPKLTRGPPRGSGPSEFGSSTMNKLYLSPVTSLNSFCSFAKTSSLFPLRFPRKRMPSLRSPNGSSLVTQKVEYPNNFSFMSLTSDWSTFSGPKRSISLTESTWKLLKRGPSGEMPGGCQIE